MGGVNDPTYVMLRPSESGILRVQDSGDPGYKVFGKGGKGHFTPAEFWNQYWSMVDYGHVKDDAKGKHLRDLAIGALFFMMKSMLGLSDKSSSTGSGAGGHSPSSGDAEKTGD